MKKYISIFSLALLLVACGKEEKTDIAHKDSSVRNNVLVLTDAQLKNIDVDTTSFKKENLPVIIRLNAKAEVTAQNTVSITNPYGGYVKQISLIPGNNVAKGQSVVVLEDPQYIQMQEDYLTTKALLEQASADFTRQKELNQEKAASDKTYQQARATQQTLLVKKRSLEEKLKLININPSTISLSNIRRTINVYSPINGVVNAVNVNIGQYVSPADAMLKITNASSALLNIKIFEKDLPNIVIGQSLKAFTNANPDDQLTAQITAISNQVNPDGTVDVFAKITNLNKVNLTANMYFNVELEVNQIKGNILPTASIVHYEGKDYIFEVQKKNQFKMIPVVIGASSQDKTEISTPLPKDKIFVGKGAYQLLTALKTSEE